LCGFRDTEEISQIWSTAFSGIEWIADPLAALETQPPDAAVKQLFQVLISLTPRQTSQLLDRAEAYCKRRGPEDAVCRWVGRLREAYPDDAGALSPMMLHLICLEPGQALYLPAGEPHAYLEGVGMELMANSDNVLRGGLTGKHVDVPELMRVLRFQPRHPDVFDGRRGLAAEKVYETPAEEFCLSMISVDAQQSYHSPERRSVEIGICVGGSAELRELPGQRTLSLHQGSSFIVPAACAGYRIQGEAMIYKASVPL
jgi:mannose-6-phosphate isomerase